LGNNRIDEQAIHGHTQRHQRLTSRGFICALMHIQMPCLQYLLEFVFLKKGVPEKHTQPTLLYIKACSLFITG